MKTVYFQIYYGLNGCYMPDSHYGAFKATTRREMVDIMRDAIAFYDMPKSALSQIKWNRLFAQAKLAGSVSSIHVSVTTKANALTFSGMTKAEYLEYESQND